MAISYATNYMHIIWFVQAGKACILDKDMFKYEAKAEISGNSDSKLLGTWRSCRVVLGIQWPGPRD